MEERGAGSGERLPGPPGTPGSAAGGGHLLDVFPHLGAVIADHQQLQRVVHEPVLRGQSGACGQGAAAEGEARGRG